MVTCDLSCENGGYCSLLEGEEKVLSKRAAAGQMLERCVCRPGYGGIACEQTVDECSVVDGGGAEVKPLRSCHSGVPCKKISTADGDDGQYRCDCGAAMAISRFAYEMCLRPATEYCGRANSVQSNSFCTNGGSCTGNLGLRIEDRGPFQHEGCVCPPEFHGPHCEYLVGYGPSPESYGGRIKPSSSSIFLLGRHNRPGSAFISVMILFGWGAAVVILAVVAFKRNRHREDRGEEERRRELDGRELSLGKNPEEVAKKQIATVAVPYSDVPPPNCGGSGEQASTASCINEGDQNSELHADIGNEGEDIKELAQLPT